VDNTNKTLPGGARELYLAKEGAEEGGSERRGGIEGILTGHKKLNKSAAIKNIDFKQNEEGLNRIRNLKERPSILGKGPLIGGRARTDSENEK